MKEKEYKFVISKSINDQERIIVKESDLTEPQKNLLLGEVVKLFSDLPEELQNKFVTKIFEAMKDAKNR